MEATGTKPRHTRWGWLARSAATALGFAILVLALSAITNALRALEWEQVAEAVATTPWQTMALAVLFSGLGSLAFTGFDHLSLRCVGKPQPWHRAAIGAFISQSVTRTAGFATLIGASIRWRIYHRFGLSALDIARVVAINGLTFALGAATMGACAALLAPGRIAAVAGVPQAAVMAVGAALALALVFWLVLLRMKPVRIVTRLGISLPGGGLAVRQLLLGSANVCFAAATMYVVLPPGADLSFLGFLTLYMATVAVGLLTHVPGGLGIFEGMLLLVFGHLPAAEVMASAVLFRVAYNLIPLALATILFGAFELSVRLRG